MVLKDSDITEVSAKEVGGKAANLFRLTQAGFKVPRFLVIPYLTLNQQKNWQEEVQQYFDASALLAVRSSADVEDGAKYSFAGQFETVLNVPLKELLPAVKKVADAVNSATVQAYLAAHQLPPPKMSVIIQEMVQADFAGVAFGVNPITGNRDEIMVNVVHGLGETLVSGERTADAYVIKHNKIVQRVLREQAHLTDEQIILISKGTTEIGILGNGPQDIEFAFKAGECYWLQARPVTNVPDAQKIVYDNSNIIESYPGLTSPLTYSFILKMYAAVYKQLSGVLGISKAKVRQHEDAYNNMLGCLNGRVYYNLNSWYTTLSLLPGYNLNASFMEGMMGVKNKPEILVQPQQRTTLTDYLELGNAVLHILYNAFTVKKQKYAFVKKFNRIYNRFAAKDYRKEALSVIWADYQLFEQMMTRNWKAPLVNDFFAMIYFGLLQKQCRLYMPEQQGIHNELLASSHSVITTAPIKLLPALVGQLMEEPEIRHALLEKSAADVWSLLQLEKFSHCHQAVIGYVNEWGERCVGELKLETITYKQDVTRLIEVLQQYAKAGWEAMQRHTESPTDAKRLILDKLNGKPLKKWVFNHVLKQARYLVANRENLRYYRTLGFGMVRQMMLSIAEQFVNKGLLQQPRDIFYLELHEVEQVVLEKLDKTSVQRIIQERKLNYELFETLPLPERVITNGKQHTILAEVAASATEKTVELKGIPCSPGIVKATICKVTSVNEAFPNAQIMATYATDPGYVVMFAGTKGILTERGSLLSHAAIVSREMNIPCIVGITGLMEQLQSGDEVIMDGSTGIIKILNRMAI